MIENWSLEFQPEVQSNLELVPGVEIQAHPTRAALTGSVFPILHELFGPPLYYKKNPA